MDVSIQPITVAKDHLSKWAMLSIALGNMNHHNKQENENEFLINALETMFAGLDSLLKNKQQGWQKKK